MKKRVVYICMLCLGASGVLLLWIWTPHLIRSRTFQLFGGLTYRVHTTKKVIALTLDDAPTREVPQVLNVLRKKHIKATFYEIGQQMEGFFPEAKAITQEGMEQGNHSYLHDELIFKPMLYYKSEIEDTNNIIRSTGYTGPITFRPPFAEKFIGLPLYLHLSHVKTIMWDVDPDVESKKKSSADTVDSIVNYTLTHAYPGSIIVLHPFCEQCDIDRQALPRIIDGLKEQGYEFITVSELLAYQDK